MKNIRKRSFLISFAAALVTMASACVYTVFDGTVLASGTTPIEIKGFAPQGTAAPGQTLCLMARDYTQPVNQSYRLRTIATTTAGTGYVHQGPDGGGGSNWLEYVFAPAVIPSWAWSPSKTAEIVVSNTCGTGPVFVDFTARFFANQTELTCFRNAITAGAQWNDTSCAPYRSSLHVSKP